MAELNVTHFLYGGDYNPDQWPEQVWEEDVRLMKTMGVNTVSTPIFSWAHLQPAEDTFDFEWFDRALELLRQNDIQVIMATPTAAQPAWLSKKYPDVLPVTIHGLKRKHGARNNFCPNSPNYRRAARRIAEKLAERCKEYPGLLLWHVSNEYGSFCYCDTCAQAFREWLKRKYGRLDILNEKWNTRFWSHTFSDWDEIEVPSYLNEVVPNGLVSRDASFHQPTSIDYRRFMSDSLLACYRNEVEGIRTYTPHIPVTTNMSCEFKHLDLHAWGPYLDIMAWDNYPKNEEMESDYGNSMMAMKHDIVRGVKPGKPFLLLEQTPSQQNWLPYNRQKAPGVMRLWSYQAIARGSNSVLFFQWRQSKSGFEKYHAAMIPHAGHTNTRVSRELTQLGHELQKLDDEILGAMPNAKVAILFDWSNWWAAEYSSGPSVDIKYQLQVNIYYKALYDLNIPVDVVSPKSDLSQYEVVIAPVLYMVALESVQQIETFASNGGTFITTYFSGLVDENDTVFLGGYPGAFRKVLGIWVEETDALTPTIQNRMVLQESIGNAQGEYQCGLVCDVVHAEGAEVLAVYGTEYYKGIPCLTENSFGKGKGVYLASKPEEELLRAIFRRYCDEKGIKPLMTTPEGVEVTQRSKDGINYTFILNHTEQPQTVKLPDREYLELLSGKTMQGKITINSKDVYILRT